MNSLALGSPLIAFAVGNAPCIWWGPAALRGELDIVGLPSRVDARQMGPATTSSRTIPTVTGARAVRREIPRALHRRAGRGAGP